MSMQDNDVFSPSGQKIEMDREDFHRLTGRLFGAYQKLDDTLAHALDMASDMVRTASRSGLQPETGQLLFNDVAQVVDTIVASRKQLVKTHRRAHVIRMRSTQAFEGCPPPYSADTDKVVPLSLVS